MITRRFPTLLLASLLAAGCAAKAPPAAGPESAAGALDTARAALREAEEARAAEARRAMAAQAAADAHAAALERTEAELRRLRDANRRLEERADLLQRALERTETELIRSQARLRGGETKAQAASAIAEARILMGRLNGRGGAAALCRESLAKAERHLATENYGAAVFFALKAQEIAGEALASRSRP